MNSQEMNYSLYYRSSSKKHPIDEIMANESIVGKSVRQHLTFKDFNVETRNNSITIREWISLLCVFDTTLPRGISKRHSDWSSTNKKTDGCNKNIEYKL